MSHKTVKDMRPSMEVLKAVFEVEVHLRPSLYLSCLFQATHILLARLGVCQFLGPEHITAGFV